MSTWSSDDPQPRSTETVSSIDVAVESDIVDTEIETSADSALGPDCIFGIVKNQRRRHVLRYLTDHNDSVTIGALAEHIAVLENDTTLTALTSRERKRVYIALYQSHLPKMDDAGAIEFDRARGAITSGPNAAQFEPYLDSGLQESNDWPYYYLLLAGVGGLLFTIQFTVELGAGLSLTPLLVGILIGYLLLSLFHLYYE